MTEFLKHKHQITVAKIKQKIIEVQSYELKSLKTKDEDFQN